MLFLLLALGGMFGFAIEHCMYVVRLSRPHPKYAGYSFEPKLININMLAGAAGAAILIYLAFQLSQGMGISPHRSMALLIGWGFGFKIHHSYLRDFVYMEGRAAREKEGVSAT